MKHPLSFFLTVSSVLVLGAGCAAPAPTQPAAPKPVNLRMPEGTFRESVTTSGKIPETKPAIAPVPTPPAKKPVAKTVTVNMQANAFSPQTIAINEGDTIEWVNKDTVSHTVASDGALLWDSGNLAPGKTYKRTFKAGTYTYHCGSHPSMKGTVIVK